MKLSAKIPVTTMKNVISILEKVSQEAIFTFNSEGLRVKTVCANRFKLIDLWVKDTAFKNYECEDEIKLGIVVERIKDITKTLTAKDELSILYEDGKFSLVSNGIRRVVKLLRLEYMNEVKELPDFEYTFSLETSSKEVRDFLKTLGKTVAFDSIIRKDGAGMEIVWRSKNDEEPVEWNPDLTSKDEDDKLIRTSTFGSVSSTCYTTEEVLSSVGGTQRSQSLVVQGGQDIPLRFDWEPYEGVRVISLVANRM
jgi:hypothetical protein